MNCSSISSPLREKVAFLVASLMCGDTVEFSWQDDQGYFALDLSLPNFFTELLKNIYFLNTVGYFICSELKNCIV